MKLFFKVGDAYRPDEEKCTSYFDFSLLFAASSSVDATPYAPSQ
jgi:hypothetical protein